MIYFCGSETVKAQIDGFPITDDIKKASCAVIEIPGNLHMLEQISGIPVIAVTTAMLNYREAKALKTSAAKSVTIDQLQVEVSNLLNTGTNDGEDDFFFFDEFDYDSTAALQEKSKMQTSAMKKTINLPEKETPIKFQQEPPDILQQHSRRAVIAVSFSAEGGIGKTFVSSAIGCYAALKGIPSVAVDLDLGYGDLDTATGLVSVSDRTKIIDKKAVVPKNGWATVSDWRKYAVSIKQNILKHNSGLYVIPSYPYAGRDLAESEIEDLLYTISEIFGFVVVDLGVDGFSPHARVALKMADIIMLIGGQSEKTIGKISHFLKQEGGYNDKMSLVVNKVSPTGYFTPGEVAKKLGFDSYFEIPLDDQGLNAAKKQHKLPVQLPGSLSGEAVKQYAANILPFGLEAPAVSQNKSFLQKIFGNFKRR